MSYGTKQVYSYNTGMYKNVYPNVTSMSNPKAPTALSNAIADVLSLPRSAVTVNTFNSFGYLGGTNIGSQSNPSTRAILTVLYQGTAQTTSGIYQGAALTTSLISSMSNTATNAFNIVNRLQSSTPSPTVAPTPSPSSVTVLTASGISNALNTAISAFNNYANNNRNAPNLSPLGMALSNNGFPNADNINFATVQTMSSSQYPHPTSSPSIPPIDAGESATPGLGTFVHILRHRTMFSTSHCTVLLSLFSISYILYHLPYILHTRSSTLFSATVFTTFGGDIHIRGKQGQPTLNSLVNIALQVAGGNALPQVPRSLPLELGSAMHDGNFKYDLSTLLRTGEANFTGNAVVDGNQLLRPVLGLFQALYYLGKASIHTNDEASAYFKRHTTQVRQISLL